MGFFLVGDEFGWSGLAGTHESWGPQIKGMVGSDLPNEDETRSGGGGGGGVCDWNPIPDDNESGGGIEVCAFDNRGMGQSSVPTKKSHYTYVHRVFKINEVVQFFSFS